VRYERPSVNVYLAEFRITAYHLADYLFRTPRSVGRRLASFRIFGPSGCHHRIHVCLIASRTYLGPGWYRKVLSLYLTIVSLKALLLDVIRSLSVTVKEYTVNIILWINSGQSVGWRLMRH
jgi:hypothetical protein